MPRGNAYIVLISIQLLYVTTVYRFPLSGCFKSENGIHVLKQHEVLRLMSSSSFEKFSD